ncbi:MAG: hypothetical protein A3I88_01900 [Candidatus Portnoybacteria bacterium RIFCSPLOWO2_12_FULL_39_9]|uniref:PKD domain-containing protein n=1 Tax=Candidatus Portnoybacteria bacterium RIFCSPHIGHO2_12_FULL_38_9 TaxID=1801997 RepID=A0A1G2FI48_9BACT|nr:MAG: hypothetical protein A3H00_01180 [Candidatus Portnoybacteria bacterium RBG_13_40_8]OGZ36568.1 MAG: hypothetical protein A2646_00080 [Candidatus Portnoybacteria bacterium RIFCSPHIGHO2_02_FULL_39_12]OGZ37462.1 MAG: hypothetical protein A3J64_00505 [Candidatus Portnoybacteria bacterium RIFCSPHIGHO2_12_FULL_38_9]OGZ39108.1 MAG: hypothetical protein A3F21_00080 [Candidatus Portnoybacteria bacterium RIFCSPLOWO2_01_FULL_38_39]OGZ40198.1 MAG: hypothetical protein A3I88_01900 [Candidatus Portnoy
MLKNQKIKIYLLLFVLCFLVIFSSQAQSSKPEITLTWSTNSYIPFNYPGKALPTKGSLIEAATTIESKTVNPEALYYYWYLDDNLQRNKSGPGKLTFEFFAAEEAGQSHRVKLWLKSQDNGSILEKTIEIKIVAPQVYIKGPAFITAEQEKQFIALPYFFNIKNINELRYNWSIDEKEAREAELQNPNILTLKIGQVAKTITKNLKLLTENKNSPQQKTETRLKITLTP